MVFEIFYKIKSWEGKELFMNFNLYIQFAIYNQDSYEGPSFIKNKIDVINFEPKLTSLS